MMLKLANGALYFINFNCDEFCKSSLHDGVLCTASKGEKPGTLAVATKSRTLVL